MIEQDLSALGGIIAVVYLSTVGSIIWWMLHIPRAGGLEQHVQRIEREATRYARILVPVQGDILSDRLIALASQMAKYRHAEIDVIYVIEVPLQLPISADLGPVETEATEAFTKARKIARVNGVTINSHIERARQAGPAIVRYALQSRCDLLLMGDVPRGNRRGTRFAKSVEYVFENAPCEVILARPALDVVA
ncbi:MAG: universal stress protein [Chloroflexota bacterium]